MLSYSPFCDSSLSYLILSTVSFYSFFLFPLSLLIFHFLPFLCSSFLTLPSFHFLLFLYSSFPSSPLLPPLILPSFLFFYSTFLPFLYSSLPFLSFSLLIFSSLRFFFFLFFVSFPFPSVPFFFVFFLSGSCQTTHMDTS